MLRRCGAYVARHHWGMIAAFIALGGTSYAALRTVPGSDGQVHACYGKLVYSAGTHKLLSGGALRVVPQGTQCRRGEVALAWNQRGVQGPSGPQGAAGVQGASGTLTDTSQFYTRAQSDARFMQGTGGVSAIPRTVIANTQAGTLFDVPGSGKLDVTFCAGNQSEYRYTNESGATQTYVLGSALTAADNPTTGEPRTGTVNAGTSFTNVGSDSHDLMRLVLTDGTRTTDFEVATSLDAGSNACVYWGEVYSGS